MRRVPASVQAVVEAELPGGVGAAREADARCLIHVAGQQAWRGTEAQVGGRRDFALRLHEGADVESKVARTLAGRSVLATARFAADAEEVFVVAEIDLRVRAGECARVVSGTRRGLPRRDACPGRSTFRLCDPLPLICNATCGGVIALLRAKANPRPVNAMDRYTSQTGYRVVARVLHHGDMWRLEPCDPDPMLKQAVMWLAVKRMPSAALNGATSCNYNGGRCD